MSIKVDRRKRSRYYSIMVNRQVQFVDKVNNHKIFNWISILSTKFSIAHENLNSFKVNPYGNKVE